MDRKWMALAAVGMGLTVGSLQVGRADAPAAIGPLDQRIHAVVKLPGEPAVFESGGVSRDDFPLRTLESSDPLDGSKRRIVVLGGLDGDDRSVSAVLEAVRWFKTEAPAALRQGWSLVAMPCGNPEGWSASKPTNNTFGKPTVNYPPEDGFFNDRKAVENRYIWRWIAAQAPDLVLDIQGGNRMVWRVPPSYSSALGARVKALPLVSPDTLEMALSRGTPSGLGTVPSLVAEARADQGPAVLQAALAAAAQLPRSPLRQAVTARLSRTPLAVASVLAAKYPQGAEIGYIPAVAWTQTLRLGQDKNDPALLDRVRKAVDPVLTGAQPALPDKPDVAKLAGYIVFAELAELDGNDAAKKLALDAATLYLPEQPGDPVRFGRYWTDDMFMTSTLLGRAGKLSGEKRYTDLMAQTLVQYAGKLQRPDGFFIHAPNAKHAWGRGNGFAALGLMEGLTYLPASHPQRAAVLESFRKEMAALKRVQTPEGTWRQVIDHPESYREVTATAMNLAAMARGIRMGWLDRSYLPVARRAWLGLSARIADDGGLMDVCDGTGAESTLRYYYERPALFGLNDRGGAMSLLAAMEMAALK